jgi:DNA invertase Pin-like site-specific DNA recombinase
VRQPRERKTAAGYVRTSTGDQLGHISLHFQEREIRKWCDREGVELVATFRDEGMPAYADDISRRPGFAALLEELPRLRPATVIVYSLDRLTRSRAVASETSHRLGELGIALVSATD